jgi:hypothetical protein
MKLINTFVLNNKYKNTKKGASLTYDTPSF